MDWLVVLLSLAYLGFLFVLAWYGDRNVIGSLAEGRGYIAYP